MEQTKFYSVGPHDDAFDGSTFKDVAWVVYWYEAGDYEGDGLAVALRPDGLLEECGLSHCSCYCPGDGWNGVGGKGVTVEEFLKVHGPSDNALNHYEDSMDALIVAKVRELLSIV